MIAIGIIFLVLYAFFMLCVVGALGNIKNVLALMVKRQEEIIKILKNSKK